MYILRRLFLALFSAVLFFALLATAWAHIGVTTLGNRETIKSWLNDSGFYDRVVETVLENANKEQAKQGETQIPIDDPKVQAIAEKAFDADYLKETVEKVLDGTYAWLEGKTPKPEFVIDLADAKQRLADGLSDYAVERAASLPACTPEQMAAMTDGFDVLNAACLPPGTNPQVAADNLKNQILTSDEFLKDTTVTGDEVINRQEGLPDSVFEDVPRAYKLASYGPYVFGVLSLLFATAVFFLSSTKRRGLGRVGIIFLACGILLWLSFVALSQGSAWLGNRAKDLSGDTSAGQALASALVRIINQDIGNLLMWYAIAFSVLGLGTILFTVFYKRRGKNLKQPTDPKPPIDDSPRDSPTIIDHSQKEKPSSSKKTKPPTKIQL